MNFNLIRPEPVLPFYRPFGEPFFREMEEVSERLNKIFGTWARPVGVKETLAQWTPAVDIQETEKEYLFKFKVELPEISKEDVKVSYQEGILTIEGERKQEKEEKGKKFHRVERSYGKFLRTFMVPPDAEETKVTAEIKNGLLVVQLPKTEKPRAKTIDVKVY